MQSKQKILLGVTGSIAAYKAPELVRRLRDRGAEVQVVLTRSANEFVTETSLQAVSGKPVRANLWDKEAEAAMGHIELARWADQVLIAPTTAEFMSRLAAGAAPDLLTTLCLATKAPLTIAPAMNHVMWAHPAVQANKRLLVERGVRILGPGEGDQACGETGEGRMLDPDAIAAAIVRKNGAATPGPLQSKTVMITAGPTREALDPVRFISNRSSGKMAYALAAAAADAGAKVILVSGPVSLDVPDNVHCIEVESAKEMFAATHEHIDEVDIFIGAAAVADYQAAEVKNQKIKKSAPEMSIQLEKAPDIVASVARLNDGPFTVGFAAETENLREYALGKLEKKGLDMIVANKVGKNLGFSTDSNAVDVFWKSGDLSVPKMLKTELAVSLIGLICVQYLASHGGGGTVTELPIAARGD